MIRVANISSFKGEEEVKIEIYINLKSKKLKFEDRQIKADKIKKDVEDMLIDYIENKL